MKLAIVNGANRIANTFLKSAAKSGKFQSITVADLYPNYESIQEFLRIQHSIANESVSTGNKTLITDTKLSLKTDLEELLENSTHVAYFTHNYYTLVPAKQSIFKNTVEILKSLKNVKSTFVSPIELDHYGEKDVKKVVADSESLLFDSLPNSTYYRSDLTFGRYSEVLQTAALSIKNLRRTVIPESSNKYNLVHSCELVNEALKGLLEGKGGKYIVKGPEALTIEESLQIIADHFSLKANFAPSKGLPASFISELKYSAEERNFVNFGNSEIDLTRTGFETITTKNLLKANLEKYWAKGIEDIANESYYNGDVHVHPPAESQKL